MRCKSWFNTECKDAMEGRKSAITSFTNITSDNLSNFRVAQTKARRACCENKRSSWQHYMSLLGTWFVESVEKINQTLFRILDIITMILSM